MSFLQNREVYFNQESLTITLPHFPLQKSCQTQRISTHKLQCQFFNIVRDKMHLSDHKKKQNVPNYLGEN